MGKGRIEELRSVYHRRICEEVLRKNSDGEPNNADRNSKASVRISKGIIDRLGCSIRVGRLAGQTAGRRFEKVTRDFLCEAFGLLSHLRPGEWDFSRNDKIQNYEQYQHLAAVSHAVQQNKELRAVFGDYIVKPDIVICRVPVTDEKVNEKDRLLSGDEAAGLTPLRRANSQANILHASVSCKWTLRSDRSQNARTEGLNLVRNRKGNTPHIVVVVGEPSPGRIAPLAYGTGDIDCVYHFALRELMEAAAGNDSDSDVLHTLVEGRRLRDISDLPFDLAV